MSQRKSKITKDRTTNKSAKSDESKLHKLCDDGNLPGVRKYIETSSEQELPAKLSTRKGVFGYTPLHLAVAGGHTGVLEYLLSKCSKDLVNCRANSGYTPLHLAASSGHRESIKILLTHGGNIAATDEYGKTPKQSAELSSKASIVKLLRSEEIIKEVETNGSHLTDLLQQDIEQLEPDCLSRALMAATRRDNSSSIGKLIIKGASNIDECIEIALEESKHESRAMLLLVKAALTGNKSIVQKLFGNVVNNPSSLQQREFNDEQFSEVQNAVTSGTVTTVVPIDIARKHGNVNVREELLMKTDVSQDNGTVLWHGLRLLSLEISWLRRISWVKRFKLAKNGFKTLPPEMGAYLKQVVKLDLQHNELSQIPRCLLELPSLGELNLAHNSLEEIPDVVEWSPCLTVLDLSHNHLAALPYNVIAPAIKALNLSHNQFRQVPVCICSFTTLHSLNLSENPDILQLPAEMGRLHQLSRLLLDGLKDLNDPPRSIQKDAHHCIRYLNSKLRCAKGFYKMKLMLVGQANRGKTTLVARLQGKDCGNESTVGVDVSEWSYKPSLGKNKFYFSIWDFGGQEEYYATHQCFLSERSLYLLLFNLKHREKGVQELKSWLNNIAMRAPNSMVIIVGTHLDEVTEAEREEVDQILQSAGTLAGAYTNKLNIPQILPVGLTGRIENVGLLKDAIYAHAAEYTFRRGQPIMGRKIPASFHALDKRIETVQEQIREKRSEPIMNSDQFKAMVLAMNLPDLQDDEELKTATLFLTDIGSLLHYDDRSHNLNELYFIDPRWLCDMMAKVVTIKERNPFVKKGILHSKDIRFLFRDDRFPWEHFEQYLTLLDRFEIALPLDNRRVLIPSMLPVSRPEELNREYQLFSHKPLFTRYIIFIKSTTPPGFWSRLLSRIMHSVQKVALALDKHHEETAAQETSNKLQQADTVSSSLPPETSSLPPETSSLPPKTSSLPPETSSLPLETSSVSFETSTIPEGSESLDAEQESPTSTESVQSPDPTEESSPPIVSGPIPGDHADISFTLPHFPSQLPITLQDSFPIEDITLRYWREGLFYKDPGVTFRIESLSASRSTRKKGDGVLLSASPSNEGKKILGQLVDIVLALIQEWYPGIIESSHGSEIDQRVLCIECMKQGRARPFEFRVNQCLKVIAANQMTMECGFHKLEPARNHTVSLIDIVPDLLLQDIDAKFLLKKEDIVYEENDASLLGKGGYGKVFRGECHGKEVAIKKYLNASEEALTELRVEAKLLQQSHHPCFVCLEGVCVYPMMALVLELAPLGALSFPLLKKKLPIHRLTIFRIALEVAAALRFVHKQGIVFRDLKADNVLLWTLNPDSLCHCKITDFGIATHLSPVGIKGLKGTKGFIAPEVLHIDKRKQRSVYDYKADTFSFAMFLYQLIARRHPYHDIPPQRIDAYIEMGERPKLSDVSLAYCAYSYLTKLMETCWRDNPRNRPDDDMLINKLSLVVMQSTMTASSIRSHLSPRRAIAITPSDFAEAGVINQLNSELWVFCDGAEGAEINMYNTHTMAKVNKSVIKDNQVQAIIMCGEHLWIGSRAGIDYSVVDIFSLQTKELVHNIRMRDISVSCMACTSEAVFVGTLEGYCFRFSSDIEIVRSSGRPRHKNISKNAIDGIVCTQESVWISHTKHIYFTDFNTIRFQGSLQHDDDIHIGQLFLTPDGEMIWGAHLNGGSILSAWNVQTKTHCFDVNTSKHLLNIVADISTRDAIMTAVVPAEDCLWVGMATGHILVMHNDELLTWFHPYTEYVRFLTVIPCSGPCEMEKCMVASGGKGFQSMIKDFEQMPVATKVEEKDQAIEDDDEGNDKGGFLVVWEAFSSKTYKQMNLIQQNGPEIFDNHSSVRQAIQDGDFVDGTNLLITDAPQAQGDIHSPTVYTPDLDAKPYHDSNYDTPQNSDSSSSSDEPSSTSLTNQASSSIVSQSSDVPTSNPLPTITRTSTLSDFRNRTTTVVSSSICKGTKEVFEVKLISNQQIIRITCPTPPQLSVVLSQLQGNASVREEDCRLVYYSEEEEEVHLRSQEQFDQFLKLRQKPQLLLETKE